MRFSRIWPDPAALSEDELFQAYRPDRAQPSLRVNFVTSLDGAVESDGVSRGISSDADRRVFGFLRAHADAVMVGAGTLRKEAYGPPRVRAEMADKRRASGAVGDHPTLVVVSAALKLDPKSSAFVDAAVRPVVVTVTDAPADQRAALAEVADLVTCGAGTVDLACAREALTERGLRHVLCEGGPHLFGALVAADLVDELCLTVSPLLAGAGAGRIVAGEERPDVPLAMDLAELIHADDGTLLTRYRRSRPD